MITPMPLISNKPPLLVIPAYNAAGYLGELIGRIRRLHPGRDVLVINDGSSDNTGQVVSQNPVRCINFKTNRGKGAALLTGYCRALAERYSAVISMDADLQHAPEDIQRMRDERRRQPEAVILGSRMSNPAGMPLSRRLSNNLTSLIVSIFSGRRIRDTQSGFRVIPLHLLHGISIRSQGFAFEAELAFILGMRGVIFREVPVSVIYRGAPSHIHKFYDSLRFAALIWRRLWG